MVIADTLAARAPNGFFCNVNTVNRFCKFWNYAKTQLNEKTFTRRLIPQKRNGHDSNPLRTNPTKWSNKLKQFVGYSR